MKRKITWTAVAGAAVLAATMGAAPAAMAAGPVAADDAGSNAQLSVLHGIPNTPVDVWVNGKLTLDDFKPGTLAGPLSLAPATYSVAITKPDATSPDNPIIGPVNLPLAAGGNYTAVAHLDASGKPTATLFTNDISKTPAGEGRLTVRHVAAAPAVDVVVGGKAVVSDLTNPNEKVLTLPATTVSASVTATGTTTPALIGPADVTVKDGENTIVYAYGSASDKTLALMVQTVGGMDTAPNGVSAGTTGAAYFAEQAQQRTGFEVLIGTVLAAMAAAGVAIVAIRRRKVGSSTR